MLSEIFKNSFFTEHPWWLFRVIFEMIVSVGNISYPEALKRFASKIFFLNFKIIMKHNL